MAKYTITEHLDRKFVITLDARNGRNLIESTVHHGVSSCYDTIMKLQTACAINENYVERRSGDGWHYFTIIGPSGEVLGTSKRYKTRAQMRDIKAIVYALAGTERIVKKSTLPLS